jgi:hypothetical protein
MRHRVSALAALAAAGVVAAPALAATPTIHATPKRVERGHRLHVFGRVPGCPRRGSVTLVSTAFRHDAAHDFAGVGAVFARQHAHHRFSVRPRIPATRAPGRYSVSGRCGGANIGVTARFRVVR